MSSNLLKGSVVAQPINEETAQKVISLRSQGWVPHLASLHIGDNSAANLYIRNQQKSANKLGIDFENKAYSAEITQEEMLAAIHTLNVDPRVTGIILQRPVPTHLNLFQLQAAIAPSKDVEGMSPSNIGKVVYDQFVLSPCTAAASVQMLRHTGLEMRGLEVVIIGHSEIVGKPIALHLLAKLATVTVCHHETRLLSDHTRRADALFVAVGKPGLISADMVKPGAVVIDIGINQVPYTAEDGTIQFKTVGDVDFEAVDQVAGWITPVPGGVGVVTLAMLMRNTVAAVGLQKIAYENAMLPIH